jgi:hypothetical protein
MIKKDLDLERKWQKLRMKIKDTFGIKPKDMNGVLYLVGIQELGKGNVEFTKEQKQDLMHIAICKVLSSSDYYKLEGHDDDGWPHWKSIKNLPHFDLLEQEVLLKMHIIEYFENEIGWDRL